MVDVKEEKVVGGRGNFCEHDRESGVIPNHTYAMGRQQTG